jgi:hypothetical protein
MRTALLALTLTLAGLIVNADHACAQAPGRLRVTVRLTDSQARITVLEPGRLLTVTAEGGAPMHRFVTDPGGTVDASLPPGVYVVASPGPIWFQGRYYRWSERVLVSAGAVTALELTERNGQSTRFGPFVEPFVQYGAPQRLAGGIAVLFPIGKGHHPYDWRERGVELQASGGLGGWRVAVGAFDAIYASPWSDVLLTVTRTSADPRGASPESTYVGVEAGLVPASMAFLPWRLCFGLTPRLSGRTWLLFKPSLGLAYRVDGPEGLKRTMFTWSVGAHVRQDVSCPTGP